MGLLRDYLSRRWQDQQGQRIQEKYEEGLWENIAAPKPPVPGTQAGLFNMGPFGESTLGQGQQVLPYRPDGLMTPRQQERFAVDVMSQPSYRGQGARMLNDQWERDWSQNNMSMYDRERLAQNQQKLAFDQQLALGQAGLTPERIGQIGDDYSKEIEPLEISQNQARYVDQLMASGEPIQGPAMEAISSAFLTAIRPGEAQMEGDVARLARSIGIKGTAAEFMAWMTSNPEHMKPYLEQMHRIIRKRATLDSGRQLSTSRRMAKAYGMNERQLNQILWRGGQPYVAPETTSDDKRLTEF